MKNDDLYHRYEEIMGLLLRAFEDVYILEEVDVYNNRITQGKEALLKPCEHVLQHLCEVIKTDLGLSVWKLRIDSHGNNTISVYYKYFRNISKEMGLDILNIKTKLPCELRITQESLHTLRTGFLAHNDITREHVSITREDVKMILEDTRRIFNEMCYTRLDERIRPLTDEMLLSIKNEASFGLGYMINKSVLPRA